MASHAYRVYPDGKRLCLELTLHSPGINIYVDIAGQAEIMTRYGALSDGSFGIPAGVPTFPLNTGKVPRSL